MYFMFQAELKELDDKFRKAMISNAQLDNEKATLTYEVELMKDRYTELEETHTQLSVSYIVCIQVYYGSTNLNVIMYNLTTLNLFYGFMVEILY